LVIGQLMGFIFSGTAAEAGVELMMAVPLRHSLPT
jgi:hypothetical protein